MHKRTKIVNIFLTIFVFQAFFSNSLRADHTMIQINTDKIFESPLIIEAYDKKSLFSEKVFPLFEMKFKLSESHKTSILNLSSVPHKYIGIFAYIDLNNDNNFNLNFQGNPIEPFGYLINVEKNFKDIKFEDIVFDMNTYKGSFEIFIKEELN